MLYGQQMQVFEAKESKIERQKQLKEKTNKHRQKIFVVIILIT